MNFKWSAYDCHSKAANCSLERTLFPEIKMSDYVQNLDFNEKLHFYFIF